jgi:hypothetical protein
MYVLITDTVTGLLDDVIWAKLYQTCAGHGRRGKITEDRSKKCCYKNKE